MRETSFSGSSHRVHRASSLAFQMQIKSKRFTTKSDKKDPFPFGTIHQSKRSPSTFSTTAKREDSQSHLKKASAWQTQMSRWENQLYQSLNAKTATTSISQSRLSKVPLVTLPNPAPSVKLKAQIRCLCMVRIPPATEQEWLKRRLQMIPLWKASSRPFLKMPNAERKRRRMNPKARWAVRAKAAYRKIATVIVKAKVRVRVRARARVRMAMRKFASPRRRMSDSAPFALKRQRRSGREWSQRNPCTSQEDFRKFSFYLLIDRSIDRSNERTIASLFPLSISWNTVFISLPFLVLYTYCILIMSRQLSSSQVQDQ